MGTRTSLIAVGGVVAVLVASCQGAGTNPRIQTGRADAAEGAISIETGDWTYGVPLDGVSWTDEMGTWHDGGRPDCLAPGISRQIRFAAVEVTVEGATWRPVVWISCQ